VDAGIGLFFSALMVGLTALQSRYTGFSPKSADEFNSASRSVKPGLIAAGIVSAWTWAATLVRLSLHLPCTLSPPDIHLIWHLLVLHHSCNQVLWRINTGSPVRGGMALARQFKFCYSPRSVLYFQIRQSARLTRTCDDPISFLPSLSSTPRTLTPGSRSLVLVGENLLTSFSSSSGEFHLEN